MSIELNCPRCRAVNAFRDDQSGQTGKCGLCQMPVHIPAVDDIHRGDFLDSPRTGRRLVITLGVLLLLGTAVAAGIVPLFPSDPRESGGTVPLNEEPLVDYSSKDSAPKDPAPKEAPAKEAAPAPAAADPAPEKDSWTGKIILIKRGGIKISGTDAKGTVVYVGDLKNVDYKVLDDRGGQLKVNNGRGAEGWFAKAYAVLLDDAVAFFTEQIRQYPNDDAAYNNRGMAWKLKGEFDFAILDYGEAIRLNPTASSCYNNRGTAWYAKRNYDKAIADYSEAIRLNPTFETAFNNRGIAWYVKKEYDKAIADHGEALRLDANYVSAYLGSADAWRAKKDYDRAIADYSDALRLEPANVNAFSNRGFAWLQKREYDKAIADCSEAIHLNPKGAAAYDNRGDAYRAKREYDKAIADYNEAIRLDPRSGIAYCDRGAAYFKKGDFAKAQADIETGLRLAPDYSYGNMFKAWLLATCPDAQYRDGNKAVEFALLAMGKDQATSGEFHAALAAAHAEAGNFDEAVRCQELALHDALYIRDEGDASRERLESYRNKKAFRVNN